MWLDRFAVVCSGCPDLVAVYEAPDRRLALLLCQTLVPLPEESGTLRRAIRNAVREVSGNLRAAGFRGGIIILQWQPLGTSAAVMRDWRCCYDADPTRRAQLQAVAERYAADERYLAGRVESRRRTAPRLLPAPPPFATPSELHALQSWYDGMAPSWLGIEPLLRRSLVLKTHRWVAEHIFIPAADGRTPAFEIRQSTTRLGCCLFETIPPDDRAVWSIWVDLVVGDLDRAMRRPSVNWNQAWARWLLLIAYSVPVPRERPASMSPVPLTSPEGVAPYHV